MASQGFGDGVSKWSEQRTRNMSLAIRKISFDVYGGVVKRTPVDTGYARGNWRVVVGGPVPQGDINRKSKKGSGIVEERIKIAKFQAGKGDTVFLFNNTAYIVPLDRGHSGQNRQGIVSPVLTAIIAAAESGGNVEFTDVSKTGGGDE